MNDTVEISLDLARTMLPCLESRLEDLGAQIDGLQREYDRTKTAIAELRSRIAGQLPLKQGDGLRKRKPKGFAEIAVEDLLKSLPNGPGLTMSEIKKRTGLNHSSVFRTLKEPKRNQGRFVTENGKWKLAVK